MTEYKAWVFIDGKSRWIIKEDGKIINKNPSKEELKGLVEEPYTKSRGRFVNLTDEKLLEFMRQFYEENGRVPIYNDFINNHKYPSSRTYIKRFGSWNNAIKEAGLWDKRYNTTHTCDRCGKSFNDVEKSGGYPLKEYDEKGNWTGRYDCPACRSKYDPNSKTNILKSIANCRTGNQNPNHSCTKGDKDIDLACVMYGYENLNKKYDNYTTIIDCIDPKTGLYHQVKGRSLKTILRITANGEKRYHEYWEFGDFEREWNKEYEDVVCFCKSSDGKRIERIYRFPHQVIEGIRSISIMKNSTDGWYEEYRVKHPDEIMRANKIWEKIEKK